MKCLPSEHTHFYNCKLFHFSNGDLKWMKERSSAELEDELQRAKTISDEMFKTYKGVTLTLTGTKKKADQLVEKMAECSCSD